MGRALQNLVGSRELYSMHRVAGEEGLPKKRTSIKYVHCKWEEGGQGKNVYLLLLRCHSIVKKRARGDRMSENHQI